MSQSRDVEQSWEGQRQLLLPKWFLDLQEDSQWLKHQITLDNLKAPKLVSYKSCTSDVQEQHSTGPSGWHALLSAAIFFGSCWSSELVVALCFWGIFEIYWNRLHFLIRLSDKGVSTHRSIAATKVVRNKRNRFSQVCRDIILENDR